LSTIPMPALAKALEYPRKIEWDYSTGVNIKARIKNCDAYVSLLIPDPSVLFSRVSITGDELIIEFPRQATMEGHDWDEEVNSAIRIAAQFAIQELGIDQKGEVSDIKVYNQKYSKILPIDEHERKNFIHWASSITGKAWQLGRYATWRPNLLLDDLVNDVRTIDRWMSSPTAGYDMDMLRGRAQA